MYERIKSYIFAGEFKKAKELFDMVLSDDFPDFEEYMHKITYDSQDNIAVYFFILELIYNKANAILHGLAASLLLSAFSYVQGSYYLAYNHLTRATVLDPGNYYYKEGLLLFYKCPDRSIEKEEAIKLCQEILMLCPENAIAKHVLQACSE